MANKLVLGKRPESFTLPVEFTLLDGSNAALEATFKYATRTEFGEVFDRHFGAIALDQFKATMTGQQDLDIQKTAAYLEEVMVGWNLDIDLSKESIIQMCNEEAAAAQAVMRTYYKAITEGRQKN